MGKNKSTISHDKAEEPLILAIDIGTASVKTLLFDHIGRAIKGVQWRETFGIRTTKEGASEVDPDPLLEIVWKGIDAVLDKSDKLAQKIAGVATCTFVSNIMGIDRKGRPATPIFTYADTRAQEEVVSLSNEFDEAEIHNRTGCHLHSSYLPARFRWLARTQPGLFSKVDRWLSIGEYIDLKLFGETSVSYSVASWSGLLNRHKLLWDDLLLAKLPIEVGQLSSLVDINFPKRGLCSEFASRWPTLANLPWFPSIGDGAAANIGSGCTSASKVALTMGSTTAVRAVVSKTIATIPQGLWCYRIDQRRSLPGGALSEGGNIFSWMKNTLKVGNLSILEQKVSKMTPDGHNLTFLPFFAGERSPGWQGQARATIHGISLATTPSEILRAGMEAVAYRIAIVFGKLNVLIPDEIQVVASGGAIQNSPAWLQIITDVLGKAISITNIQEASARGAALLALEALGLVDDLTAVPSFVKRIYIPDSERNAIYRNALERQKRLYEKLMQENRVVD